MSEQYKGNRVRFYWGTKSCSFFDDLLERNGHDLNLGKKSKRKHCILKSYNVRTRSPYMTQRPHFTQQLTIENISLLETGKAFCSILRGRKKNDLLQSTETEANKEDTNIINKKGGDYR